MAFWASLWISALLIEGIRNSEQFNFRLQLINTLIQSRDGNGKVEFSTEFKKCSTYNLSTNRPHRSTICGIWPLFTALKEKYSESQVNGIGQYFSVGER